MCIRLITLVTLSPRLLSPRRYVYQSHYDCQGQFWIYCAHRIIICLGIMSSFTAGGWSAGPGGLAVRAWGPVLRSIAWRTRGLLLLSIAHS